VNRLALATAACAACGSDAGVIDVQLAVAPGSTLLDGVQTLRMTITSPRHVVMADRTSSGFDLAVELDATGASSAITVDGLDAQGDVIASGATPRFSFGGLDGHVVVFMAAPNSVSVAPTSLEPARTVIGTGNLAYGAVLAGGTLETGFATDAVSIYNAYDHTLLAGRPLPAPRAGIAVGVGTLGIYMFGGVDEAGNLASSLWRYDPNQPPSGIYYDYGERPEFARAAARFVPTGNEHFLLTGSPGAELLGLDGSMVFRDEVAALPTEGVTVTGNDGTVWSYFAGIAGVVRCRTGMCENLAIPGRDGARVVALPGGKVGLVCGTTDLVRIDASTGVAETIAGVPSNARRFCAAAVTSRHLVIAGGMTSSGPDATVEVFDAATLEPVAVGTLTAPRIGADAIALPNDQVLIASGIDASEAPVGTIELFTPANP
jgi:hypothetical protein